MNRIGKKFAVLAVVAAVIGGGVALVKLFHGKGAEATHAFIERCRRNHANRRRRTLTQVPPRRFQRLDNLRDD